jgi:uncharacterized membrane protein
MSYSKSFHPALVHFPVAFITTAQILDIVYGLTTNPRTSAFMKTRFDATAYTTDIVRLSYLINMLGVLSAIPAIISGGLELAKLLNARSVPSKLKKADDKAAVAKKVHPKVKFAFTHAIMMDIVVAGAGYNWYTRRSTAVNAPGDINVLISALTLPLFGAAGYLGGLLVQEYGVGVNVRAYWGGAAKEE